jgi:hypothetical protein
MRLSLGYAILVLTIYTLAVARMTRLVNADTILDRPRVWISGRARSNQAAARESRTLGHDKSADMYVTAARRWETALYFVQCPWCVGMWLALASAYLPVWIIGWPAWAVLPVGLAVSHLVGITARFADTEDISIEDDTPTG